MNYEKLGLRLDIDPANEKMEFREVFGITKERAEFLDKKVLLAKSMIAIEGDVASGLDYFLSQCKHVNESHYCWLRLGQKCECRVMSKVSVLGSKDSGIGGFLDMLFGNIKNNGPQHNSDDLGEPLG